jgi:hypothetical protein
LKAQNQSGGGYEVPQTVIDLIEDKVDELKELKSKIEAKLFRLTLTTSRGERVNPTNDYLGWLAMSLFRQWIAENTTPEVRGIPGILHHQDRAVETPQQHKHRHYLPDHQSQIINPFLLLHRYQQVEYTALFLLPTPSPISLTKNLNSFYNAILHLRQTQVYIHDII